MLAFGLAAIAAQVYDNVTDADGVAGLDRQRVLGTVPVGIVTVVVGGLYLIALLVREAGRRA
ncbi:hypothetical protein DZG03_09285 [Clavibacter phaseoli]|nr:hypothetical protein DZG03_09285 [Clavibacter phaseoli]